MKAAVYQGNRTFDLTESPVGDPGPLQVRIDVAYTGICGTDLHIYHGDMDSRVGVPAIIGHEMSGRIAAVGDGVEDWSVGDPVTVMPLEWCGQCPACASGNQHICHQLNFIGIDSAGALQNSWVVPAHTLVRLPADMELDIAALIEPTAVACHDVRRSSLAPGEHAVVVGGGPVGLLIAQVARRAGAEVVVLELDAYRRSVAEHLGLVTVDPSTVDLTSWIEQWTAGAGAEVAFEVSGAAAGVNTAVDVLGTRGRLVMVAIHSTPRPINLHRFFWRELQLLGARLYDRTDFERAAELVHTGEVQVGPLISRVQGLDEVPQAFLALETGAGVMKVLIDCQPVKHPVPQAH